MSWADDFTWVGNTTTTGPTNLNKINKAIRELKALTFNVKDYGATGDGATDDTAAINLAITAMTSAGGGRLFFPAGIYQSSGGHTITVPCLIFGEGAGATGAGNYGSVLRLWTGANTSMLTISAKFVTVSDLGLEGTYSGQSATSNGIVISTSAAYGQLRRLSINSFRDDGILFSGAGTTGWATSEITMRTVQGYGININASAFDNDFHSINIGQSGKSGVRIAAADNTFNMLHSWGNGTAGVTNDKNGVFIISGTTGSRFVNCYLETNAGNGVRASGSGCRGFMFDGCSIWKNTGQGVYVFSALNFSFTGCQIYDNGPGGASGANGVGICNDTGSFWTISGCNFFDDQGTKTQTYAYYELNTADHNTIVGNSMAASQHRTGSSTITGTNNVPVAASMGTLNQV